MACGVQKCLRYTCVRSVCLRPHVCVCVCKCVYHVSVWCKCVCHVCGMYMFYASVKVRVPVSPHRSMYVGVTLHVAMYSFTPPFDMQCTYICLSVLFTFHTISLVPSLSRFLHEVRNGFIIINQTISIIHFKLTNDTP